MAKDLSTILQAVNVASLLAEDEDRLNKISRQAYEGYEGDKDSCREWLGRNEEGMKLAMQIKGAERSKPFQGSANVMYPGIGSAAMQFSARAYPNLIPGREIVKGRVIGKDADGEKANKAARIATHMNWQLNEEMVEWKEETDRLLTVIPITGSCFKETYWSVGLRRIVSHYYPPNEIIMHYKARSMETVPRITKRYDLYPYQITERIRAGTFIKFDVNEATAQKDEEGYGKDITPYKSGDEHKPHLFLQQHCFLDLDGDGYPEPYVANIHYDTKQIVRIAPRFRVSDIEYGGKDDSKVLRIAAQQHYTMFTFMPSPDGSIYGSGFGSQLAPLNHVINSVLNMILDAGTLSNSQGGFMSNQLQFNTSKASGPIKFGLGEFKRVMSSGDDLRKNIVPLNEFFKEPSPVLFNLLGFMVQALDRESSVSELMSGEQSIHNE
ncbi:hypothetical protein LCGC14_0728430, partial [marine sediment metagenome]